MHREFTKKQWTKMLKSTRKSGYKFKSHWKKTIKISVFWRIRQVEKKAEDLEDKQKIAQQLEELRKEFELFSSFLSHDLRAPLRSINGYMKMIQEDRKHNMDEECQRIVDIVQGNAKKATELMDDLLAFSRVTTRELTLNQINMNDLINEVLSDLKSSLEHGAQTTVSDLHSIKGDFSLIYLVFTHLLSNAIKFSSKTKSPLIEIQSKKDGAQIIFSVKDNGIGIDMKLASKLFEGFHRLHDPADFEGTGMGLAIVHRIVKKHGGKVWIESEPDKGATIYCSFPEEK